MKILRSKSLCALLISVFALSSSITVACGGSSKKKTDKKFRKSDKRSHRN